jgi:hypothetical protein
MKRIALYLTIVILTSCSDKITKNQLAGVYIWNNSQNGKLTINSDMTYSYKFDLDLNDSTQNVGTCEFDSKLQEIHFNNFRFTERDGATGVWISRVRIRKNEIQLNYASDSNIYLKKIE